MVNIEQAYIEVNVSSDLQREIRRVLAPYPYIKKRGKFPNSNTLSYIHHSAIKMELQPILAI